MYLKSITYKRMSSRENGFLLMAAIFIMVVLSASVVVMMKLSQLQSASNSLGIQSSRALLAAQGGLEWGVYRASGGSCVASSSFTMSEQDLNDFDIVVTCSVTNFIEGAGSVNLYSIESVAQWGTYQSSGEEAMPDYVYRKVNAVAEL